VANELFLGENGCAFGCLGYGDCVDSCDFNAMKMDGETRLPVIFDDHCVSCGACVKACPRDLIIIWPKGKRNRRVWVACQNREKGAVAVKNCKSACIACNKCVKTCQEIVTAITMENNLATIHQDKCIRCGKCIPVCPTGAIMATFPYPVKTGKKNKQKGDEQ
jgi:Fe-S-cluster-containing hydrogenase component 2